MVGNQSAMMTTASLMLCHLLLSLPSSSIDAFTPNNTMRRAVNVNVNVNANNANVKNVYNNVNLNSFVSIQDQKLNHNLDNTKMTLTMTRKNKFRMKSSSASSYEFDSDESSEQLMADKTLASVATTTMEEEEEEEQNMNGASESESENSSSSTTPPSSSSSSLSTASKFDSVLKEVGLDGQLSSIITNDISSKKRVVSRNDVFCNRELNMSGIRAIGFDMDYTIVQYKQPAFDKLAFDGAKEKLVHDYGYPAELLDVEYDHTFWVRGLIIDTKRGNFLKIDRHKYVRVAYHGFTPISQRTRKDLYSRFFNQVPSFSEKQYVNMDTLFQFVDASLFATLVEMKDKGENFDTDILDFKTYDEIYKDIRQCVDLCHRDGVIKDEVARDPEKYIVLDDDFIPMMKKYRDDGVKVFLLTNSFWEYTSDAMNYLYHQKDVDKETKLRNEWVELFDLVVVGSCKPAYLLDPYLNLFRVNPQDGSLLNTDGIFEINALGENGAQKFLDKGTIFQGGNWKHLTAMLEIEAGEEIMYVGDHLYSDVLRSKRTLGWRSVFIMPELPEEMETFYQQQPLQRNIQKLRKLRDELSLYADTLRHTSDVSDPEVQNKLEQIEDDDRKVKQKLKEMALTYHRAFHPVWGMMFSAGYQDSRLAYFVTNYACLYTAKATNLGLASTNRSFRTTGEALPHDKLLSDDMSFFPQEE